MKEFERMKEMNKVSRNTQNTKRMASYAAWIAIFGMASSAYAVEANSPVFRLSMKDDGVRLSAGNETLTYSSQWIGEDPSATIVITDNGTGTGGDSIMQLDNCILSGFLRDFFQFRVYS